MSFSFFHMLPHHLDPHFPEDLHHSDNRFHQLESLILWYTDIHFPLIFHLHLLWRTRNLFSRIWNPPLCLKAKEKIKTEMYGMTLYRNFLLSGKYQWVPELFQNSKLTKDTLYQECQEIQLSGTRLTIQIIFHSLCWSLLFTILKLLSASVTDNFIIPFRTTLLINTTNSTLMFQKFQKKT